jgi:hypothetical protein
LSLFVTVLGGVLGPPPSTWNDPEFELPDLARQDFELAGHYRRDGGPSQINSDRIWGGAGDDLLYGQGGDDSMQGNAGSDLVFGGDGAFDSVQGGPEANPGDKDDVRPRGDDWPKRGNLTELQTRVAANVSAVLQIELQHAVDFTMPVLVTQDVNADGRVTPLDVLLLINFLNADTEASSLFGWVPPAFDVNRDGRVTPLDVLLVINFLNSHPGTPAPEGEASPASVVNRDGRVTPLDVLFESSYVNTTGRIEAEGEPPPSPDASETEPTVIRSTQPVAVAASTGESRDETAPGLRDGSLAAHAAAVDHILASTPFEAVIGELVSVFHPCFIRGQRVFLEGKAF